jgi:PAS domain S-box-containing protein
MTPTDEGDGVGSHEPPYRLLAEMASDVAMQISADDRVVWISPAIEEVLGWSVEEIVGTSIFDRMHPEDVARGQRARDNVMSGQVVRNDLRFLCKDGTWRWMSARLAPVVDEQGTVVGRVAGWHDVTAEYTLREQLHEREERFRFLVENANDVVLQQVEGRIVFVSPAVQRILGWEPADLVGRELATLWHVDDHDAASALQASSLRADSTDVVRMLHRDGSLRWMEISASPVTQPDGRAGSVSILRDVTETVQAERDAQEASLAKTVFLSRMSHELRTPLNAVLGFAQLLQLDHLTPSQAGTVDKIITGGRHLLDLINEVLDITRIESGRMSMTLEPLPLVDVVMEAIDLVQPMADSAEVTVTPLDVAACDSVVVADRQRVVQVLLNLLSNAVKYHRPAGSVTVRCVHLADGMVGVEVEDDGPGIAPESLGRLFEPFERLGAERTGIEGTGIGLAVAQGLAEAMHGRIEVRSTVDVGSTFTLVLPGG